MSFQIIVKKYQHFNRAIGKQINSRRQYENEMARGGYIPFEKAQELANKRQKELRKDYDMISDKALSVCRAAKEMADSKGNIKTGNRLIEGMKSVGVDFDLSRCPKHYRAEGGFE